MTEFELHVMGKLDEIHAQTESVKTAVEGLAGPLGRVTAIEKDLAWQDKKQFIHTSVVVPVAVGINLLVKKLIGH